MIFRFCQLKRGSAYFYRIVANVKSSKFLSFNMAFFPGCWEDAFLIMFYPLLVLLPSSPQRFVQIFCLVLIAAISELWPQPRGRSRHSGRSLSGCAESRPWSKNADVVTCWDQVQDIKCSCASPVRLDSCACHLFSAFCFRWCRCFKNILQMWRMRPPEGLPGFL